MNRVLDRVIADGFQLQRRIFVPETKSHADDTHPTTPPETLVDREIQHRPLVDAKKEIDEIFDSKWSNKEESGIRLTRKRSVAPGTMATRGKEANVASTSPDKEVKEWFIERDQKEVQMWDLNSQSKPSTLRNSKRRRKLKNRVYDEEYDRGRVKKVKKKNEVSKSSFNPFQAAFERSLQ